MSFSRRNIIKLAAATGAISLLGSTTLTSAFAADKTLKIGVIGAGWLGGTVAKLWVKAGYQVMFSTRHLDDLRREIAPLGSNATVGTPAETAKFADVILFAVPYAALPQLGRELAADLKGEIVIDACNPSGSLTTDLAREAAQNGVAETSVRLLPGTRYVRAFSAVDATAIESSATRQNKKLGVPVASDDQPALSVVAALVVDAGSIPVITGNLASAKIFQRGGPGFRANTDAEALRRILNLPENT